ncbi:hypothetical protein RND81_13G051100 [Saponaria officinalis]|uniref:Uncharacterized protein n=1 Tax=Saponaria officinalis TaxID=3572 RepID=A0AAW1GW85_SAPOF
MAAGWVKSMQCKSRAYDDVISCRNSYQNLKDVVNVDPTKPKPKHKPKPKPEIPRSDPFSSSANRSQSGKPKPEKVPLSSSPGNRVRRTVSAPIAKESGYLGRVGDRIGPFFPSVTELPKEHPSRNVVEIIFHTRWGPTGFSGRVEMVFKVHNPARTSACFEEYRDSVRVRAGPGSGSGARCVADGNEMMRFQCLGAAAGLDGVSPESAVCTYSGSGAAHDSGGGGKGKRAMVVCRVIAGRVSKRVGLIDPSKRKEFESGQFDSISGENGELLVFDSRAVLPCFIVIYKL